MMKQSKINLIQGNTTHFGSEGIYYSYRNKGNYDKVKNSSVGQYINRSYGKRPFKTQLSHFNAVMMENTASNKLGTLITGMTRTIPNIRR